MHAARPRLAGQRCDTHHSRDKGPPARAHWGRRRMGGGLRGNRVWRRRLADTTARSRRMAVPRAPAGVLFFGPLQASPPALPNRRGRVLREDRPLARLAPPAGAATRKSLSLSNGQGSIAPLAKKFFAVPGRCASAQLSAAQRSLQIPLAPSSIRLGWARCNRARSRCASASFSPAARPLQKCLFSSPHRQHHANSLCHLICSDHSLGHRYPRWLLPALASAKRIWRTEVTARPRGTHHPQLPVAQRLLAFGAGATRPRLSRRLEAIDRRHRLNAAARWHGGVERVSHPLLTSATDPASGLRLPATLRISVSSYRLLL